MATVRQDLDFRGDGWIGSQNVQLVDDWGIIVLEEAVSARVRHRRWHICRLLGPSSSTAGRAHKAMQGSPALTSSVSPLLRSPKTPKTSAALSFVWRWGLSMRLTCCHRKSVAWRWKHLDTSAASLRAAEGRDAKTSCSSSFGRLSIWRRGQSGSRTQAGAACVDLRWTRAVVRWRAASRLPRWYSCWPGCMHHHLWSRFAAKS